MQKISISEVNGGSRQAALPDCGHQGPLDFSGQESASLTGVGVQVEGVGVGSVVL